MKYRKESNTKGYPWPASAITVKEMEILANLRERTGKPITELIRLAIQETKQ